MGTAPELVPFSPYRTQGKPGGSELLDRNLDAIKAAIDRANATIIRQQTSINQLITTTNISISTLAPTPQPVPSFDSSEDTTGDSVPDRGVTTSMVRYWVSTPDPSVPMAVNLGAVVAGILGHTVAGGVSTPIRIVESTGLRLVSPNLTVNLSTGLAGGQDAIGGTLTGEALTLRSNLANDGKIRLGTSGSHYFDESLGGLAIGGTTLAAGEGLRVINKRIRITGTSSPNLITVENTAGGISDYAEVGFINDLGTLFRASIYYTSSTYAHPDSPANSLAIGNAGGASAHVSFSPNNVLTVDLVPGGVLLPSLVAGGVTYATAATGRLKIGTAAEVAAAITWPASERVLFSSGTTTAPASRAGFEYDPGDDIFWLGAGLSQGWFNTGNPNGGSYERVAAFWLANVWTLTSQTSGGTVRAMSIDASTSTLTLNGNAVNLTAAAGINVGTAVTTAQVTVAASSTIGISAGAVGSAHPSASFASAQLALDASVPSAVAAGAGAWDGLKVTGSSTLTGAGTALIRNATTFAVPTITGTGVGATVNEAATVAIAGGPTGSGLTINTSMALWVQAGAARFDGDVVITTTANGAVATALTSLGPVGSHTTVQAWLKVKNTSGTAFYVPMF